MADHFSHSNRDSQKDSPDPHNTYTVSLINTEVARYDEEAGMSETETRTRKCSAASMHRRLIITCETH